MPKNEFISIYKCLCDLARLRVLNLLLDGPLCVCHVQSILKMPQPKVSRLLITMKKAGLLDSTRENNWSYYFIVSQPSPLLVANLQCLQDARQEHAVFARDAENRRKVMERLNGEGSCLPLAVAQPVLLPLGRPVPAAPPLSPRK